MDRGRTLRATWLAAASALAPCAAHAYVVTYDFAGTGQVCDYVSGGADARCANGTAFTGAIVLDVDERGPRGDDANVAGDWEATDGRGWVTPAFEIAWGDRVFSPQRLEGETGFDTLSIVSNDFYVETPYADVVDELYTRFASVRFDADVNAVESVIFRRGTTELDWLDGLAFADELLAPGADAFNVLEFVASRELDPSTPGGLDGFYGAVTLTSLVRRAEAVPEPSSLLLGVLGLLAGAAARPSVRRAR